MKKKNAERVTGDTDPTPKAWKIGTSSSVASDLQTYLTQYETYLTELPKKLRADSAFDDYLVFDDNGVNE